MFRIIILSSIESRCHFRLHKSDAQSTDWNRPKSCSLMRYTTMGLHSIKCAFKVQWLVKHMTHAQTHTTNTHKCTRPNEKRITIFSWIMHSALCWAQQNSPQIKQNKQTNWSALMKQDKFRAEQKRRNFFFVMYTGIWGDVARAGFVALLPVHPLSIPRIHHT